MTIKEAEVRTGLTRANIRYYEDQGFFTAARGENGYRDYREADIEVLLKIKLLRQLGFPLEEIHAVQRGELALGAALERREAGLVQQRQELERAARLCRDMRMEGADFYTLDARRYLDQLSREEAVSVDQDPVRVFPWRRYFARTLDMELCTALLTVLLQLTVRINILRVGNSLLLKAGALAILAGMETLTLHFLGTTPGKALLGLKVLREDGSRLSLEEAGRRAGLAVAFFGGSLILAGTDFLLFMLAGLAMLIWACWQAYHGRRLFWEQEDQLYLDGSTWTQTFWAKKRSWLRVVGYLAAVAACIGLMAGGHCLAARPLHMGPDMTAEQFVDNYNQYMAFTYGEANLSRRLTADGTFEEIERPGAYTFNIFGEGPVPEAAFQFTQKEGRLTGVTLSRIYESHGFILEEQSYAVSIPYEEALAAVHSFLYGRLGGKKTGDLCDTLMEERGNLHSYLDGVEINSEMRFSGYSAWGDSALFAGAGQSQSYFVELTMALAE